jgi:predicted ester cyclase
MFMALSVGCYEKVRAARKRKPPPPQPGYNRHGPHFDLAALWRRVMMREEIVALFDRREGAWRSRDAAALAMDHAPDGVVISPTGGVLEGRDDIERIYRVWFNAFADFAFTVEDLLVEGNRVALLGRVTGKHSGEFFGMPATGRRIDVACGFFYRFEGPLIAHERRILDFTGLLVQVGVLRAKPAGGI